MLNEEIFRLEYDFLAFELVIRAAAGLGNVREILFKVREFYIWSGKFEKKFLLNVTRLT